MHMRRLAFGTLVLSAVFLSQGCISISGHGLHFGAVVWTDEVPERLALDTSGLENLEVTTHNGPVRFTADAGEAYVIAKKKGGGLCHGDALNALEALEVFIEPAGAHTQKIGYRFKGIRAPSWNASVAFEIHAPGGVNLVAGTHNGSVKVVGLQGNLELRTHNGEIRAETTGDTLSAVTHNGGIHAKFAGTSLELQTHNGEVTADLTACGRVDGSIKTHNGGVEILVGDATSLDIDCHTDNGGITCSAPLEAVKTTKRSLHGKLGGGEGNLAVETHNGGVLVKDNAG